MPNQRDIERFGLGKLHWNKWAIERLAEKEKLKKDGQWLVSNSNKPENEITAKWMEAATCDFSDHQSQFGANFGGFIFPHVTTFFRTDFRKSRETVNFEGAVFHDGISFGDVNFGNLANFEKAEFHGAALFGGSKFRSSANFSNAVFHSYVDFHHCEFIQGPYFVGTKMLEGANFAAAKMNFAHLKGFDFSNSNLMATDLRHATFNQNTVFRDAEVEGCKVDRHSLECLDNYGGLSVGDRMTMVIHDDYETLHSAYSGYQQWIHMLALASFIAPYLWFVLSNGIISEFHHNWKNSIPLWKALAQFVYSGGNNWQLGFNYHWSFALFLIAFLYNLLRFALLLKTKKLELVRISSGIPVNFSFRDKVGGFNWGEVYKLSKFGFIFYLIVVAANTFHFMTKQIPI